MIINHPADCALEPAPQLSVIVPTYNEYQNVPIMIQRLRTTLSGLDWEVIFVDDNSPDGTAALARTLGKEDRRVRCIRRINRRGLSGAFIEGALASQAPYVAIIDGDLQHDESCLKTMLEKIRQNYDLVVASRYTDGGSSSSFSTGRARLSRWATHIAHQFLGITLSDPMSGFFMVKREVIEKHAASLRTQGFKILLDLVITARDKLQIAEIPYSFRKREFGQSKLDARIALDFVSLVVSKLTAGYVSGRFVLFSLVGLIGLGLHMALLKLGMLYGLNFEMAQTISTILIIACNFTLNNSITYGDRRLTGKAFLFGLISFELICSVGVIANVSVGTWVYDVERAWWVAGLCGAIMGLTWNYLISSLLVWRKN